MIGNIVWCFYWLPWNVNSHIFIWAQSFKYSWNNWFWTPLICFSSFDICKRKRTVDLLLAISVYCIEHLDFLWSTTFFFCKPARAASRNTLSRFSLVFNEHSTKAVAPICCFSCSPSACETNFSEFEVRRSHFVPEIYISIYTLSWHVFCSIKLTPIELTDKNNWNTLRIIPYFRIPFW